MKIFENKIELKTNNYLNFLIDLTKVKVEEKSKL